jgi:hypothetical protein
VNSLADGGLSAPICGITTTRSGRIGLFPDGNAGWAEVAFGAVDATADLKYDGRIVFVRWSGFDEGDKISPDGSVELQADGSVSLSKMATTLSSPRAASDFFNSLLGDPLDRPGMAKDRHLGGLGAAHRWAYKLQPHRRRTFSDRAIPALPPSSGTSSGAISHYSTPSRTFSRR